MGGYFWGKKVGKLQISSWEIQNSLITLDKVRTEFMIFGLFVQAYPPILRFMTNPPEKQIYENGTNPVCL